MSNIRLVAIKGEPDAKDKEVMIRGLLAHHAKSGHPRKSEACSVLLKNKNDKLLGTVIVTFLWNGMEINSLWVDESIRNQGWGRKLVEAVEQEAVKRGCTVVYTNTFPWQAPEFYEKLGYTLYGKLEDLPPGSSLSYYSKKLAGKKSHV
jgi:ribosomal protein S18 acetylase RimI-like enzyme